MEQIEVRIRRLRPDAIIPKYQRAGDSGFDFVCVEDVTIPARSVKILPTGIAVALPDGVELQLRLRSSAALRTPLIIPNAPATIDAGYRGEIGIIIRNLSDTDFTVAKGERIAQGVIMAVKHGYFVECDELPESERGAGGYGSTGNK